MQRLNSQPIRVAIASAFVFLCGCFSTRLSTVPYVDSLPNDVALKRQYRLVGFYKGASTLDSDSEYCERLRSVMEQMFPNVFSAKGTPFVIRGLGDRPFVENAMRKIGTGALFICSILTLPVLQCGAYESDFAVQLADGTRNGESFKIETRRDWAFSLYSPAAWLCFNGPPDTDGRKNYYVTVKADAQHIVPHGIRRQAIAYATVSKLAKLEQDMAAAGGGEVEPYRILKCEKADGRDALFAFSLELTGANPNELQVFRDVQHELRTTIRNAYLLEADDADENVLVVDFPDYRLNGKILEGTAVVLMIKAISLTYDKNTRKGRISVRFRSDQFEETRRWVRKNIETLARNSNIAQKSGDALPPGRYYSLGEEIKGGNVLEAEFKTE